MRAAAEELSKGWRFFVTYSTLQTSPVSSHSSLANVIVMLDSASSQLKTGETPLLEAKGLTKRYGDFLANDAIDIDIYPHEIHALLGENGAGKSTLVKMIYGLIQLSYGEMFWQGKAMVLSGPSEARQRGIGMVFQHFSLFENLTVAENVALGLDDKESFKDMSRRLTQVSADYGLPLDPRREVWQLSVGERQRIEIVRALMQNPKFLILDEPTAVLTPQEADQLFVVLNRLKAEGRAILYISHKLEEVKRLCDTATILRGGKKVATCNPKLETASSLARMMVGSEIKEVKPPAGRKTTIPRLVVVDLNLEPDDPHGVRLKNISFELKGGEILGIAGVAGNGQDELFAALSGERLAKDPGTIVIEGIAAGHLAITQRRKLGAAFVPEERLGHGTAPRMKLSENALLTGHAASGMVKRGFVNTAATLATVDRATETFDVRKAKRDPEAASLSGGNLQKFVVGREILRNPGVLVVNQPTWGVDAGAAAVIRQALLDLAGNGAAVLVTSQDLDELTEIADRIAVMFHGCLSASLATADATREKLGLLMGGSSLDQKDTAHAVGA
jgi:general nucleoside transport system ATP-binding protein